MKRLILISLMLISVSVFAQEVTDTFKDNILGSLSLVDYLSAFLFAGLGLFLRHAIIVRKGVVSKDNGTKTKFDWKYWFANNFMTKMTVVLTNIVVIFLMLRFAVEWVGIEVSMSFAFVLGLSIDWAYDLIRKLQKQVPVEPTNPE